MPGSERPLVSLAILLAFGFGACRLLESANDFSSGGPAAAGTGASAGAAGVGGPSGGGGAGGAQAGGGGAAGSNGGGAGSGSVQCTSLPSACAEIGSTAIDQAFGCCLGSVHFWCESVDAALKSEDCAHISLACDYDSGKQLTGCVKGLPGSGGTGGSAGECSECSGSCQDCELPKNGVCETNVQTSPDHCGACGHSCLGGGCMGGKCQPVVLAASQPKPWGIAADPDGAYWTLEGIGSSAGSVVSSALTGEQPGFAVLTEAQAGPASVRVDTTHAYWTTFLGGDSSVRKVRKDGTGEQQLAAGSAAWSIALDETDVYWTNLAGSVRKVAKTGGSPVSADYELTPWDIQVDGESVYWTTREGGQIRRAPKSLSPVTSVLSALKFPLGLSLTADRIFWVEAGSFAANACDEANGAVYSANKDGTDKKLLADKQACPTRIDVVNDEVFWTNAGTTASGTYKYDGSVMHVKTDGSGLGALVVGQVRPHGIVVAGMRVFWTTQGATSGQGAVLYIRR